MAVLYHHRNVKSEFDYRGNMLKYRIWKVSEDLIFTFSFIACSFFIFHQFKGNFLLLYFNLQSCSQFSFSHSLRQCSAWIHPTKYLSILFHELLLLNSLNVRIGELMKTVYVQSINRYLMKLLFTSVQQHTLFAVSFCKLIKMKLCRPIYY